MATYSLGSTITTKTPKRPELSNNGGDYYFYETPILKDGVQVGVLHDTSAEFDFCQLSGNFEDTVTLFCEELNTYVSIGKHKMYSNEDYPDGMSIEELLSC